MTRIYLDHNATTPLRPEARAAFAEVLAETGNPSSVHADGRRARARLDHARDVVADAVGAAPEGVVFTSGGAEALNLAIGGAVASGVVGRVLVSAIEHDVVREAAGALSGATTDVVPVTASGVIDLEALERLLAEPSENRTLVAVMHANNETGVIQPTGDVARLVREANGLLLIDAVQSFGKIDVNLGALGANYLALSAHKLGGPMGAGALILADDAPIARRQHGGGQERGRRAGTENLAGIAGFAAAVEAALGDRGAYDKLADLRDDLEARVTAARDDVRVFGAEAPRLSTTSCLALPGFSGETQVMALDLAGVSVSAGAACSSGKVRPSHVLAAMGADERTASSAIRVSLGWTTTADDIDRFVTAYLDAAERAVGAPERVAGAA
ncbi:MAG: cysteine desulfurase family protein [Maricaulaceae bacterium]|jgi:cysteine desulfurase